MYVWYAHVHSSVVGQDDPGSWVELDLSLRGDVKGSTVHRTSVVVID